MLSQRAGSEISGPLKLLRCSAYSRFKALCSLSIKPLQTLLLLVNSKAKPEGNLIEMPMLILCDLTASCTSTKA